MNEKRYSEQDLQDILKNSLKEEQRKSEGYSEDDIIHAAKEMGVDESTVRKQLDELKTKQATSAQNQKSRLARKTFMIHCGIFIVVNLCIFGMNLQPMRGRGMMGPIALFPFFPWIIFLVMHGLAVFSKRQPGDKTSFPRRGGCCR